VLSRLDNGCATLAGLARQLLERHQSVLNAAARLIFTSHQHSHVPPPVLRSLHWLLVPERITFWLAVLAYCCLHGLAPAYLASELAISSLKSQSRTAATIIINNGPYHPVRQPCHRGKSRICGPSQISLEQQIAWHPYVTVSDHFQIAPQDQDVPAVIRLTSTVSVTAVNCTMTLKYIFALTSR